MPKRPATWNYSKSAKRAYSKRKLVRKRGVRRSKLSVNVHRFCRYAPSVTVSSTTATESDFATTFALTEVQGSSEFTSLFDRYRIEKIEYKIQLLNNPDTGSYLANPVANNNNNFYPKMWYVRDYDDASAESIATMQQRAYVKCCVMKPNMQKKITIRPAILTQLYLSGVAAGYAPKFNQFIDMQYPSVPHYGLKIAMDYNGFAPAAASLWQFRIDKKYTFVCKDVR